MATVLDSAHRWTLSALVPSCNHEFETVTVTKPRMPAPSLAIKTRQGDSQAGSISNTCDVSILHAAPPPDQGDQTDTRQHRTTRLWDGTDTDRSASIKRTCRNAATK